MMLMITDKNSHTTNKSLRISLRGRIFTLGACRKAGDLAEGVSPLSFRNEIEQKQEERSCRQFKRLQSLANLHGFPDVTGLSSLPPTTLMTHNHGGEEK